MTALGDPRMRRARALAGRLARRTATALEFDAPTDVAPHVQQPAPEQFWRELQPGPLAVERGSASARLRARLTPDEIAAVEERIAADPALAATWNSAPQEWRDHLVFHYGVHLGDPAVCGRTGLGTAQPPGDVHAMARGPEAAAGGLYEADLVADALASAGVDPAGVRAGLDFGCSSGRVVRVMAAAYPDATWHACDPNGPAIAWAQGALPGIAFFRSGDEPPLPLDAGSLDLAYAISIWSHFAPALGLRWFEEMHRLLAPGGHLVFTTHGPRSVAYYALERKRPPAQCEEIVRALYTHGWWYAPEFGEAGDWGVTNSDWGTAFQTPEWLLAQLTPRWRVLEYASGRNQWNQDVYVLERV